MTHRKFATRYIIATIILVIVLAMSAFYIAYTDTVISNQLALNQLNNDNYDWMFLQMYTQLIKPTLNILTISLGVAYVAYIITITVKYMHYKKSTNLKETTNEENH